MYASAKVAARLAPIFAGFDSGAYSLPADLLAARTAVARLQAEVGPEPTTPDEAQREYVRELVAAARTDTDMPALTAYRQTVGRHADWLTTTRALQEAVAVAEGQMRLSDDIITEHLRPALVEVESDLARLASVLPADASDRFLSSPSATRAARQAWSDLEHLAARYSVIMKAYILVIGRDEHDDQGEWSWLGNLEQVWPSWRPRVGFSPGSNLPPWPDDPRQRLLWLAHHGAQFVVLTRDERTERFLQKYGEDIAKQQQYRLNAQAFGAIFG